MLIYFSLSIQLDYFSLPWKLDFLKQQWPFFGHSYGKYKDKNSLNESITVYYP